MKPETTHMTRLAGHKNSSAKLIRLAVLTLTMLLAAGHASAMEITEWRFQTSIYTHHWSSDPDHVSNSKLLDLEFETSKKWVYGFAYFPEWKSFSNSCHF